jgi:hypothetical protein
MTGRLQQGEAVFSNHVLSPFDRAPRGLSVMPGFPPLGLWDCQTGSAQVSSCATDGYAGRTARYTPAPFDASVALNTGECLKVALASARHDAAIRPELRQK